VTDTEAFITFGALVVVITHVVSAPRTMLDRALCAWAILQLAWAVSR
jgi:hypothetical protein